MAREVRVNIVGDASRLERSLERVDGRLATTGKAARRMQGLVAGALAGAGIVRGGAAIVQTFARYDTALREVGAVSQTSGKSLQQMGQLAREAGLQSGVGATAATQAMGELAKAGLQTKDLGPALRGTLQLAQAGGLATADAAQAAANAMSAFGLEGSKATQVADAYANAANLTTADVGDFALAMSQGSSAAKTAGLSFGDTTLALTQLARNAVKGSDAGTSLKAAITQLASPTKDAQDAMSKYGLSFFTAGGEMKSVADISGMLHDRLGGLTKQQRLATLTDLAGTDGQRALGAMMGFTRKEAEELQRQLERQGSAAETATAKQAGFQGSINKLKAAAEELGISLGEKFAPEIAQFADQLTRIAGDPETKARILGTFDAFRDRAGELWDAVEPGVAVVGDIAKAFDSLPGPAKAALVQLTALSLIASKLRGIMGPAGAAGGVSRLRSELDRVPASSRKAAAGMAADAAATARASSKFAMGPATVGDAAIVAKQQAVLARRQAAAAERIAALNAPTRGARALSAVGGLASAAGGFAGRNRGGLAIGAATGGIGAAVSGGSIATAAMTGAALGSAGGPIGIAAGALVAGGVTAMVGAFSGARKDRVKKAAESYAKDVTGQVDRAMETGMARDPAQRLGQAKATLASGARARDLYNRGTQLRRSDSVSDRADGIRLQNQGRDLAKSANLDVNALVKGTSNNFKRAGEQAASAFGDGLKTIKRASASGLLDQFRQSLGDAPRSAQQAGATAVVRFAQGLEDNKAAPKGTTNRLIQSLAREFDGLAPIVSGKARATAKAVARGLDDGDAVKAAAKTADGIVQAFRGQIAGLPQITVKSLPGAVAVLRAQMDRLRDVVRTANPASQMSKDARAALPDLRNQYRRTLSRMATDMGMSKDEAADWARGVSRAARRAGDGSVNVDALQREVASLTTSFGNGVQSAKDYSAQLRQLGLDAQAANGFAGAISGIQDTFGDLLGGSPAPTKPKKRRATRRGGLIQAFQGGGLVPIAVSPGEELEYGGYSMTVPGAPVAADNVEMAVPAGTKVWTGHSQAQRAAGLDVDVDNQIPHFVRGGVVPRYAKGGIVEAAKAGRAAGWTGNKLVTGVAIAGPESGYRNDRSLVTSAEDSRGMWQINTKAHTWARNLNLKDPYVAARAAERVRAAAPNGWGQWTGYTGPDGRGSDGAWRNFIGQARKAVLATRGLKITGGKATAGGGTSESTVSETVRRRYGRSATRGGLLDDAYGVGIEGVSTFGSRAAARRYGNPVTTAIRDALDAQSGSYTRTVERTVAGLAGEKRSTAASRAKGIKAGGGWGGSENVAMGLIRGLTGGQNVSYKRSASSALSRKNPGSDHSTAARNAFAVDLAPGGSGLFNSIASRAGIAAKMGSWNKFPNRPIKGFRTQLLWHAPDGSHKDHVHLGVRKMRTGGIASAGLAVGRAVTSASSARPSRRMQSTLADLSKSTSAENIDDFADAIGGAALARVDAMRRELLQKIQRGGDRKTIDRLRTAVSAIEADLGGRIAEGVAAAQGRLDTFEGKKAQRDHAFAMEGVDSSSALGLRSTITTNETFLQKVAPGARRELEQQRAATKREMAKATTAAGKATLAGQLNDIRGKIKDLDTSVLGSEEEVAAAKRALPKQLATERVVGIDLAGALAGLTVDKGDDRGVLMAQLAEQQRQMLEAQRAGDLPWLTEAANAMKSAADGLRDFDDAQREGAFSFDAAMAALTETETDDKDVLARRAADAERRLNEALAAGDRDRATQAATDLKGFRDAMEAAVSNLTQELIDSQKAVADLLKEQNERLSRNEVGQGISRTQLDDALRSVLGAAFGSRYTNAVAAPGVAGGGTRL